MLLLFVASFCGVLSHGFVKQSGSGGGGPRRSASASTSASTIASRPRYPTSNQGASNVGHRTSTSTSSFATVQLSSAVASTAAATAPDATAPDATAASVDKSKVGNKRLAAGMCFLTAWADMVLNAKLATFCSMLTGNTLWMIKALSELRMMDGLYYFLVIASYGAGAAMYRTWQQTTGSSNKPPRRLLPTIAAIVTLSFVAADRFMAHSSQGLFLLAKWLPACLLSFGFSLVNLVGQETAGTMTFVVTGHITKLVHAVVDDRRAQQLQAQSARGMIQRLKQQTGVVTNAAALAGFIGGAMFSNYLRLSGIKTMAGLGEFAWIGLFMGGLFLWKDSISQSSSSSTSQTNQWQWYSMPRRLVNPFRKRHPVVAIAPVTAVESDPRITTSVLLRKQDASPTRTVVEDELATQTMIDGTWYTDEELLDSTLATDLILNNPAIAPLMTTDGSTTMDLFGAMDSSFLPDSYPNATTTTTSVVEPSLE